MKIAIGGMISSGKSTVVKDLSNMLHWGSIDEFVDGDEVFDTLLGWLYEGKEDVEMLLQVYFLNAHYKRQKEAKGDMIIDRHIIEHWLFAQSNLKDKPEILNMYNGLFHAYMNNITHPDIYFILDVDWDNFKERLFKRGREQEIANFEANEEYFRELMGSYVTKLVAQCVLYDIEYVIVPTNGIPSKEVVNDIRTELESRHWMLNFDYDYISKMKFD